MEKPEQLPEDSHVKKSLEVTIKVGLLIGLIVWCFIILKPFLMVTLWGIIIAVSVYPMYNGLKNRFLKKKLWASLVVTLVMLMVILTPFLFLGGSLYDAVVWIKDAVTSKQSLISPPTQEIRDLPMIGPSLYDLWLEASQNLGKFASDHQEQLLAGISWFVNAISGAAIGVLMFIASILISGVLLYFSDSGGMAADRIADKLLGPHGRETVSNAEMTVRNVARGILGVAFIQAVLCGAGFLVAGVPGAGLWALIAFLLAIIQVGVGPVVIIVLIYAFLKMSTLTAVLLLIWCAPLLVIDNVLKPILLGKGAPVPMLVIFLGAIGGFIGFGIIGLFVGAVVLSLGYNLFLMWLE